jgi:hypothetical protein
VKKTLMTSLFSAGVLLGQTKRAEDLSVTEIEGLLAVQVPSDVIVLKVKQSHAMFNLSTANILALKKAGASADLLRAMMEPACLAESAGAIDKQEITIPDGTEVKLLLKNPLSSGHGVAGTARGVYGKRSRRGSWRHDDRKGRARSGENIRLRSSKTATGSDSYGTVGVVTLLTGPLGALVKGKDVEVPAGTEFSILFLFLWRRDDGLA